MKKLVVFGLLLMGASQVNAQANIAAARAQSIGSTVTVRGVATNGGELGNIRYMQDGTAGIAVFGASISSVQRGDSITVSGQLTEFSGLLEVAPITSVTNNGPVGLPTPLTIAITDPNETIESQYVELNNVTFVQTGNFATGNSTVQVTNGTVNLDIRINGSTNIDGTAIPTGPVTIRGLVGQFNTNYQIVPRDLNDIFPYVAPNEEINVVIGGSTLFTGGNYFHGNTTTIPVTIENFGVGNLNVSAATFSGTNAADYSSNLTNQAIGGGNSITFNVTFAPGGPGTRTATMSIPNTDSDENPYVINFEGVGTNNLATEPTANPTNLTFPTVEAFTLGGTYTAAAGSPKYLVLWKVGSAITGVPADGNTYKRGDVVGDAKVAYVGTGNAFTPRGVIANQNYHFKVYAFNGQGGFENYQTTNPLTGNVTSLGLNAGTYYNGINSNAATFLGDLSTLINPHSFISYFNYKQTMMAEFEVRDTTNGQSYVTCAYSGERKVFNDPFDWTATNYSREHVYCHSWMPSFPADNPEKPEYTDQFNLFPTNFSQVNQVRSNYPLGVVVTVQSSYLGSKFGQDANGNLVFEPRDEMKGNAARAMFYEAVCYNGVNGQNWKFKNPISTFVPYIPYGQDQDVLKQWHFNDLPDNYEIARQEYVADLQGNRNPFIDSVDFVCYIDFEAMSYLSAGCDTTSTSNLEEMLTANFQVYPIPANDKLLAQVNGTSITRFELVAMNGTVVMTGQELNAPSLELNISNVLPGVYLLQVSTPYGIAKKKVIIE